MQALIRAAKTGEGRVKAEGGEFGSTYEYSDVDAAKALVQAGIKVRSMIGGKKEKPLPGEASDLFDRVGDWGFPDAK